LKKCRCPFFETGRDVVELLQGFAEEEKEKTGERRWQYERKKKANTTTEEVRDPYFIEKNEEGKKGGF